MARKDKESLADKRAREEDEKKARLVERQQSRRGKSSSAKRKADRDLAKVERRADKQYNLEEKAKSGDAFAQSKIAGQERDAVTAEKLGRRNASAKFKSSAYRKRQGLKDTNEDYDKVLKREVAKEGYSNLDGGVGGGNRAVSALEDKQDARSDKRKKANEVKKSRLEKSKERAKQQKYLKKKNYNAKVDSVTQQYNDNPDITKEMMEEGTADLVDSYRKLKSKKLNKNQFSKALEQLRANFNSIGNVQINGLSEDKGNLVISRTVNNTDPNNPNLLVESNEDNVIDRATQQAMQNVSGEYRRNQAETSAQAEALQNRADMTNANVISRENRGTDRQIATENRGVERQIGTEERRRSQNLVDNSRSVNQQVEREGRSVDARIDTENRSNERYTKRAEIANENKKIAVKQKYYSSALDDPKKLKSLKKRIQDKYPSVTDELIMKKITELAGRGI